MPVKFKYRGKEKEKKPESGAAISNQAGKGRGAAFFLWLFIIVGLGTFAGFFILPMYRLAAARNWNETPCLIVSSQVRRHPGDSDSGPTYSIDILYAYKVDGREYRSNRYRFLGGSSSGRTGKTKVVRAYPRGKSAVCYVNPRDPAAAVLNREFSPVYLLGLIPLVFVLAGWAGLVKTGRAGAVPGEPGRPKWLPKPTAATPGAAADSWRGRTAAMGGNDAIHLKATSSPLIRLIVAVVIALAWNVPLFLLFFIPVFVEVFQGNVDWVKSLFMIPFLLVGIGILCVVVYTFLGLFNPRPQLALSPAETVLGEMAALEWTLSGNVRAVRKLSIVFEGREEATYQRGTKTYTDKNTFLTIPVLDTDDRADILSGSRKIGVPPDTMHSFRAPHNKIVWTLKVKGDIHRWPDVNDAYNITIRPFAVGKGPGGTAT